VDLISRPYLDSFANKRKEDLKLEFYQEGDSNRFPKKYEVLTDVIVIEKMAHAS